MHCAEVLLRYSPQQPSELSRKVVVRSAAAAADCVRVGILLTVVAHHLTMGQKDIHVSMLGGL